MTPPDQPDARPGPPFEMPHPTIWPFVLSLGLAVAATGAALAMSPLLAVGGLLFVVALGGWMGELLPGRGVGAEPAGHPLPSPVAARPGAVEQLKPGTAGYRFRLPVKMHPISAGLKGGVAGGLVMPIPALLWGVLSGHGIWFPVNLLAGVALPGVGDLSLPELEEFRPVLFGIAVGVHVVMSLVIGLVYGVLLPTIPGDRWWHLLTGGVVLPVVWTGFSYAMMGVANPPLERYVDWISFAAAQLVFGLVAAVVVSLTEKVAAPPVGASIHADTLLPIMLFLALASLVSGCDAPGKPQPSTEPDRPGEVRNFGALFKKHCAGCHGTDGTHGPAPPLNDRLFLHIVPSADLLMAITDGRPGTPMPPFDSSNGGPLTTAQVKILADGLKTTWGRSGEVAPPTDAPGYTADPTGDLGRGATVFARACAGCHGDAGQGGTFEGRTIGAIRVPAYLTLSSDQVLRRYIITGRPDLGMPDYAGGAGRPPGFQALSAEDVANLTVLLASWRKSDTAK